MTKLTNQPSLEAKLSKWDILAYGCGGIATTAIATLKQQFAMKFMTDVAGISAAVIGVWIMVVTIFDAINDPIIGGMSDRCNTKYGKYRPFMMVGVLLLGIAIVMQFIVPPLEGNALVAYYVVAMVLYSLAFTATCVPWQALNSIMADDSNQRNLLLASRQFLGFFSAAIVGMFTLALVNAFGGGKSGWIVAAVVFAVISIFTMFLASNGAKKKDYEGSIPTPAKISAKTQFNSLVKNKAFVYAGLTFCMYTLATWVVSAANIYYFESVVGDINLVATTSGIMLLSNFIIVPIMPPLIKKFGKKLTFTISMMILLVRPVALIFLGAGASAGLVTVLTAITNAGGVMANFSVLSMIPDCIDFDEYTSGAKSAGLVNSGLTFMQKFGGSFSTLIVGMVLDMSGYAAGAAITPQVTAGILSTVTWIPIIITIISLVFIKLYPISSKFEKEMRAELAVRRAAAKEAGTVK
ncbi:MAG: glycoside-pentoside-hexuronide (GPH):cation symporter [Oscillospiraceae bacterium]